jgi:hypothetical protein
MNKLLVIGITSILLISGILVGANAIDDLPLPEQSDKQPFKPKAFPFSFWNFLDRLIERFPLLGRLLSLLGIYNTNDFDAVDACLVDVPDYLVTMNAWERPDSWPSFFKMIFSGIGPGYDVYDGIEYHGWCIDYGTPIPSGEDLSVMLYSSYCPPPHLDIPGWNEINWILNHKQGNRWDIQIAIWEFINLGPWTWDMGLTDDTKDMVDGANANPGYIPGPGEVVAVICDPPHTCGPRENERCFQYTFIEVRVPSDGCTRTQGYWKTHPKAWPMEDIVIGGKEYEKDDAIKILKKPVKEDMTIAMFYQLVAAKLNVASGTDSSCIADVIAAADAWMLEHGPAGENDGVDASSDAWQNSGEDLKDQLDDYNNGLLCAPKCDDNVAV